MINKAAEYICFLTTFLHIEVANMLVKIKVRINQNSK